MKHLQSLIPKLSLSVVDQALNSGGSFLVQVLLARWLAPDEFGAFAIMFSIFLFLACFSNSLVIEPMSVLGASKYYFNLKQYLMIVLKIHFLVCFLTSGLLLLGILLIGIYVDSQVFIYIAVALGSPFILFFWVSRRICYLHESPYLAAKGSGMHAIILLLGILLGHYQNWLSPSYAFLVMTIASLIAGSFVWAVNFRILNDKQKLPSNNTLSLLQSDIWIEHLNFGKWLIFGSIPNWLSKIAFIPLLGALLGLSQAGAFRALQNLILPIQQVLVAIGLFFLPWLSKSKEKKSAVFFQKNSKNITWISISIVLVYVFPLILFGEEVLQWLYQNKYYQSVSFLLPLFVLVALLSSITQAWSTMFKAMEWTYGIFLSKLIGALVTLSISWVLVIYLGLLGAVIGLLLSVLTEVCVLFFIKNKFSGRLGEDEENTQPLPPFIDRRNKLRSSNF